MRTKVHHAAAAAVLALFVGFLAGCSPSDQFGEAETRSVSTEEAERLAVARFNNYDQGTLNFTASLTEAESSMWIEGRIDLQEHVGYGNLMIDEEAPSFALLQWNYETVTAVGAGSQELPAQPPDNQEWQARSIDTEASSLDLTLLLLLGSGSDRPENPVLLRQNGAQWWGKDEVNGTAVDVFSGPGEDGAPSDALLYFVDTEGVLHRMVIKPPSGGQNIVLEFDASEAEKIETTLVSEES